MSNLVNPDEIERIVGAKRHPLRHLGRADSGEETVYILHSMRCKARGIDLRECSYSRALDMGIDLDVWNGWEDKPVVLGLGRSGLIPMRDAADQIEPRVADDDH